MFLFPCPSPSTALATGCLKVQRHIQLILHHQRGKSYPRSSYKTLRMLRTGLADLVLVLFVGPFFSPGFGKYSKGRAGCATSQRLAIGAGAIPGQMARDPTPITCQGIKVSRPMTRPLQLRPPLDLPRCDPPNSFQSFHHEIHRCYPFHHSSP